MLGYRSYAISMVMIIGLFGCKSDAELDDEIEKRQARAVGAVTLDDAQEQGNQVEVDEE